MVQWSILLSPNQSLHIKDCSLRVDGCLVLGRFSNQSFAVSERHPRWGDTVTLIVGYDLHMAILVHSHTRVGRSQIDSNHSSQFGRFFGSHHSCCNPYSHCKIAKQTHTIKLTLSRSYSQIPKRHRTQLKTLLRESGASRLLFNPQRPENNNQKRKGRSRASNLLTRHKEDDKEHRRPHRACNCRRLPQKHNEEKRRKKKKKNQPQILPMRQMSAANLQPLEEFNKSLRHQQRQKIARRNHKSLQEVARALRKTAH